MSMNRVISCIVGRRCLLRIACSLGKTLLAFALLHFVVHGQTCLLLQVSLDFLLLHFSPLWWKGHWFSRAAIRKYHQLNGLNSKHSMYVCIYIYIYTHTYIHTHTHTYNCLEVRNLKWGYWQGWLFLRAVKENLSHTSLSLFWLSSPYVSSCGLSSIYFSFPQFPLFIRTSVILG